MRAHPVIGCVGDSGDVDFDQWSSMQSRHALCLSMASATATVLGIITVGVGIAWDMDIGVPVRDGAIVAGLCGSIAAARYFAIQIKKAPIAVEMRLKGLPEQAVIEGETI